MGARRRTAPTKGDLREQAILDAAERRLATVAPDALTVEALATDAGITRGAFYFYFGSKEDVLAALVGRAVAALHAGVAEAESDSDLTPREALRRAITWTARMWRDHGPLMRLAVDLSPSVPAVHDQWHAAVAKIMGVTTAIAVRAGLPDGPGPADAKATASALVWMTERVFYQAATSGAPDLEAAAETCLALWSRGLGLSR